MANLNCRLSTSLTDAGYTLFLTKSCMNFTPSSNDGNTTESYSWTWAYGRTLMTASVTIYTVSFEGKITPKRPSLPIIRWKRSGPLEMRGQLLFFSKVPYRVRIRGGTMDVTMRMFWTMSSMLP